VTTKHKREYLEKHKIQHKFEIKTVVLLNLICFSFAQKTNRDPPTVVCYLIDKLGENKKGESRGGKCHANYDE
jgi:hypothetical protein